MIRINLLPSAQRRRKTANPVPLVIAGLVFLLVVGAGGSYFWQYTVINKLQEEKGYLENELQIYSKQKAKLDEIKRNLAELEQRLQIKAAILKDTLDVPALIAELSAFTPKDVQFTSATISSSGLNLTVVTTSYSSAANTLLSLEAAPSFKNPETSSVSKPENGRVNFSISCQLAIGEGD